MTNWDSYLGTAADDLTDDQRETYDRLAGELVKRYTDPSEQSLALNGVAQAILGEAGDAAEQWAAARVAERAAKAYLDGVIAVAAVTEAEAAIAARLGVHRTTVRRALGK